MSEEYDVGYGKPPQKTQFKKGQSGNPNGRPRKPKSAHDVVQTMLNETVDIVVNGKRKKITHLEAAILQLRNDAVSGKSIDRIRALKQLKEYWPDFDAGNVSRTAPETVIRIVDPDGLDHDLNLSKKERKLVREMIEGLRAGDIDEEELVGVIENDVFRS